jgi:hypothetical protein
MSADRLSIADVADFCKKREVEIRLKRAPETYALSLHGEFDGYGDFFSIHVADIEFMEIAGGFSVEGAVEISDLATAATFSERWKWLQGQYSPPAIVFLVAGREDRDISGETGEFIVVANRIVCLAGKDW